MEPPNETLWHKSLAVRMAFPIFVERNATYMGFIEPTPFLIY